MTEQRTIAVANGQVQTKVRVDSESQFECALRDVASLAWHTAPAHSPRDPHLTAWAIIPGGRGAKLWAARGGLHVRAPGLRKRVVRTAAGSHLESPTFVFQTLSVARLKLSKLPERRN